MRYPVLDSHSASLILAALRKQEPADAKSEWRGSGAEFDITQIDDLTSALQALRRRLGEPHEGNRRYWATYEGQAARVVHETLSITTTVAADPDFWTWVMLGRNDESLVRLVDWRHQVTGDGTDANPKNYGINGGIEEGLLSRLWYRADITYDSAAPDPYHLAYRGDQDLWRSHILRQEYGHVRSMAKALLLFQYPHPDSSATVSTDSIRAIAKELRRRQSTLAFELLDTDAAFQLIEDVRATID